MNVPPVKGIYFDFGFVIGYPEPDIERRYFYLDWAGLDALLADRTIADHLKAGIGRSELDRFFQEIYEAFAAHEQSDRVVPLPTVQFVDRLAGLFDESPDPRLAYRLLPFINTMKYIQIDPDAEAVLASLKQAGFRLSMVSNMMLPGFLLTEKLSEAGILASFDTITVSSDAGFIKPHPEIFLKTLRQDGLAPADVVFVGDTYAQDIIGARSCGMRTVWLNSRHEPAPAGDPPDYEIRDLRELIALFTPR